MKRILCIGKHNEGGIESSAYLLDIVSSQFNNGFLLDNELSNYSSTIYADYIYVKKFINKSSEFRELAKWIKQPGLTFGGLLRKSGDLWGVYITFVPGSADEFAFKLSFDIMAST